MPHRLRVAWPSDEEFLHLAQVHSSFRAIAEVFGVTKQALLYELKKRPTTKLEMSQLLAKDRLGSHAPTWFLSVSESTWLTAARSSWSMKEAVEKVGVTSYPNAFGWIRANRLTLWLEMMGVLSTETAERSTVLCVTDCGRPARAQKRASKHGLCKPCHRRASLGEPIGLEHRRTECGGKECVVTDCSEYQYAKELCNFHWQRFRLHGAVDRTKRYTGLVGKYLDIVRVCRIDKCTEVPGSSDICETHRSRQRARVKQALKASQKFTLAEWDRIHSWECVLRGDPCTYCGGAGSTIDHVKPTSKGGDFREDNLVGACLRCNASKRDRSLLFHLLHRLDKEVV